MSVAPWIMPLAYMVVATSDRLPSTCFTNAAWSIDLRNATLASGVLKKSWLEFTVTIEPCSVGRK